jgi:4-hydroxybenzoate polyprenyltransferase
LESDRQHPRKQYRPLAAGLMSMPTAFLLAGGLLALGVALAFAINGAYLFCLLIYLLVTACYSWFLKRFALLDCIALAVLYTLRIIAGAAAINMGLSFWLLAFSAFLFMSLALVKRYAELEVQLLEGRDKAHGRGYLISDAPLLQTLGVSSGFVAVLVLSLYLNSDEVLVLYATPEIVWGAVLVLLYWISWMWMQAHRGLMHDDPLVFAIKERTSLLAGGLFLGILLLGTVQTPW